MLITKLCGKIVFFFLPKMESFIFNKNGKIDIVVKIELLFLRNVPKHKVLILTFKLKVIKETNINKNEKITIFKILTEEFAKIKVHIVV